MGRHHSKISGMENQPAFLKKNVSLGEAAPDSVAQFVSGAIGVHDV